MQAKLSYVKQLPQEMPVVTWEQAQLAGAVLQQLGQEQLHPPKTHLWRGGGCAAGDVTGKIFLSHVTWATAAIIQSLTTGPSNQAPDTSSVKLRSSSDSFARVQKKPHHPWA